MHLLTSCLSITGLGSPNLSSNFSWLQVLSPWVHYVCKKSVIEAFKCCCLCRGVLSIAWCPKDPDLLVSCGKDSHILCWNPNSSVPGGEVVCDIATTNQWNFDVSWCPRNPALIASSSLDGHVSVYSLTGGQQQVQTSNKVGHFSNTFCRPPFATVFVV
jgi:WD40 repeat protein